MDVAAVLSGARRRSGLTLRQLARRAGTSHSAIAAYESGAKAPNSATLVRIVEACGFGLRTELAPLAPFENRTARGDQFLEVLDLAEEFPTEHGPTISRRFPSS
jgi:transcriptional regulator with XRE-family HTH domain